VTRVSAFGLLLYGFFVYATFALFSIGYSTESFRTAFLNKDVSSLLRFVDLVAVRESVRGQLKSSLVSTAQNYSPHGSRTGSLGVRETALALNLTDDVLDINLSQEGVRKYFTSLEMAESVELTPAPGPAGRIFRELKSGNLIDIDGISMLSPLSFMVQGSDSAGRSFGFVFCFRWYRWVMTEVILDEDAIDKQSVVEFIQSFGQGAAKE
jgi:hypothetical protein